MSLLKKFQNFVKETAAGRKYYILVVWNVKEKTWEMEFGYLSRCRRGRCA